MQTKRSYLASFNDSNGGDGGRAFKKSMVQPAELGSEQTPRPVGIFKLSTFKVVAEESVYSRVSNNEKLANFLQNCHFCRKNILEEDAFMYGYMRAFCSPECRNKQIAFEKFVEGINLLQRKLASANENSSRNKKNDDVMKNWSSSGSQQPKR